MKKVICLMLCLFMCLGTCAWAEERDWCEETARALVAEMAVLSQDQQYRDYIGLGAVETWQQVAEALQGEILSVERVDLSALLDIIDQKSQGMSDTARSLLFRMPYLIYGFLPIGSTDVEMVAVNSALSIARAYVAPEGIEDCLMLVHLEHITVAVGIVESGDGCVTTSVRLCNAEIQGTNIEEVLKKSIEELGGVLSSRETGEARQNAPLPEHQTIETKDWYEQNALTLADQVTEQLLDPAYMALMGDLSNVEDVYEAYCQALAGGAQSMEKVSVSTMDLLMQVASIGLSEPAQARLRRTQMYQLLVGMQAGTSEIAMSLLTQVTCTYRAPENFRHTVVLVHYDGADVAVEYVMDGDGVVTATAYACRPGITIPKTTDLFK